MLKNVSQKYLNLLFHNVTPVADLDSVIDSADLDSVIDLDIF